MTVQTTMAPQIRVRRRRFVIGAAALAAILTGAVLALTVGRNGTSGSAPIPSASQGAQSIMSLTPAELAANALGLGYALPQAQHGRTMASVLASLSPSTRRYTKAVMALTFAQLKAGAAGSP